MRTPAQGRVSAVTIVCVALIFICGVAAVALQGAYPTADNALFEYFGRAISRGSVLYRDVWDDKLPGVYYVNAMWQRLFGARYTLHAAAETLVALTSAGLLVLIMRDFGLGFRAAAAAVLTAFLCLAFPLNSTEAYALPALLAATLAARRSAILTGALLGTATLFWIPSLLMIFPLLMLVRGPRPARAGVISMFAIAIPLAVVMLIAGPAHFTSLIRTWFSYASAPSETRVHHHLLLLNRFAAVSQAVENFWAGAIASGVAAFGAFLLAVLQKPASTAQRFGMLWVCAMLVGTFIGTRFYSHYFIACFAAIVFAICAYITRARLNRPRATLVAAGILMLTATIAVRVSDDSRTRGSVAERLARNAGPIVARRLTLRVDAYRPELYLALDPVLRDPREIVEASQFPLLESASHLPPADILIEVTPGRRSANRVCARTAAPLNMQAQGHWRRIFAACP